MIDLGLPASLIDQVRSFFCGRTALSGHVICRYSARHQILLLITNSLAAPICSPYLSSVCGRLYKWGVFC